MKSAWWIVAIVVPAFAQEVAVLTPSRIVTPKPVVKPEAARRVAADPLRISQLLLSTLPAERLRGFSLLGVKLERDTGAPEVSYRTVNLDADSEPESILVVSDGRVSNAHVFDRQSGAWWIVGEFGYSCTGTKRKPSASSHCSLWLRMEWTS